MLAVLSYFWTMYKQSVELFANQISKIVSLPAGALRDLTACVQPLKFLKKTYIIEPEHVSESIYYIHKGLIREYFVDEKGNDISVWFGKEQDFAVLLSSFITGLPAMTGLQALEETDAIMIKRSDLYDLYERYHEMERLGRILTEQYFVRSEKYNRGFHHLGAYERYENFAKANSELMQRLSLKYVASYLGISLETLSRLRSKPA
jgi:CRP-like cAMP-binding protein